VTASKTEQEHDAIFYPSGEFDYFPNRQNPNHLKLIP
jgi:hypothetical protein